MSDRIIKSILEEIRDLDKIRVVTQSKINEFPEDKCLSFSLKQIKHRKKELRKELMESLENNKK